MARCTLQLQATHAPAPGTPESADWFRRRAQQLLAETWASYERARNAGREEAAAQYLASHTELLLSLRS